MPNACIILDKSVTYINYMHYIGQFVYTCTDALCMHDIGQRSHIVTYIVHMNYIGRFVHKRQVLGIGHSLHRRHVHASFGYNVTIFRKSFTQTPCNFYKAMFAETSCACVKLSNLDMNTDIMYNKMVNIC